MFLSSSSLCDRLIVPATAFVDKIRLLTLSNCSGVCEKNIESCDSNKNI